MRQAAGPRVRVRVTIVGLALLALLAAGCTSGTSGTPSPLSLPHPRSGIVTFYLSLPGSTTPLAQAATAAATPGSSTYRHFRSLDAAAQQFGATQAQIDTVTTSVRSLGLQFATDPTRLFGRVMGTAQQWQAALGTPLAEHAPTASTPFITYSLPALTPPALQPVGASLLSRQAQVYDATADGNRPSSGPAPPTTPSATTPGAPPPGAPPLPVNTGTPFTAGCSAPVLQQGRVYTPQQVRTAYGVDSLPTNAAAKPVVTVLDLGGGWKPSDLTLAGQCFGYSAPHVTQTQGDGVATAIATAGIETSLDVQTVSAVAPGAQLRLVQTTVSGLLDAFSRAVGDPGGPPDVISLSYGECAYAENQGAPEYTSVLDAVLAMTALTGVSTFVAAGDSGSTTCGSSVSGPTLSYPAVSPFVTAVGGTRLTLGPGNTRVSETVWNDGAYEVNAAGGGGLSGREPRPAYQDGVNPQNHRGVPDVTALADLQPGWPVVISDTLQAVGGTSGSTPFTAAATALVIGAERSAGRPPVGLANGWFYAAAAQPSAFFDVTSGNNDLAGVGCCHATVGYDLASGLGVPNWATLPAALPSPG
jgi:subtilase family serine protease